MQKWLTVAVLLSFFSAAVMADNGLVQLKSSHSVATTADRLVHVLNNKGMTVFARVNHAKGAVSVGKTLRPTELVIFGNPKVGTVLMQCAQTAGIDLPQKALIYEDAAGDVWFAYNAPKYIASRHNIKGCEGVLKKVENVLDKFARAAIKK